MFGQIEFYENEPLSRHTSFKIGGNAKFFVLPKSIAELQSVLNLCKQNELKYFIIGNGTNLLVSDSGFDGVVISLKNFRKISKKSNKTSIFVSAEAGVPLFTLNNFLACNNISGMEWSYGIPGNIGGAVKMNAGAFGFSMDSFIYEITLLKNGEIKKLKKFNFSYRESFITDEIILSITLKLKTGQRDIIVKTMNEFLEKRKRSQPYSLPSAGSIFKRRDFLPAKLIDDWGLKGLRVGDAMISQKHAGFIVNIGTATCADVLKLIHIVKQIAKLHGYEFLEEICIVR